SSSYLLNIWDTIESLNILKKSVNFNGDDFTNSNLVDILVTGDNSERVFLAEYIDTHWDAIYSYSQASISSLRILLQTYSWLPTACMTKSCKPSRLFNRRKKISSFLGQATQFLVSSYKFKNISLTSFLKIRSEPSLNDIIMIFKHWTLSPSFSTTYDHLVSLYRGIQMYAQQYPCLIDALISNRICLVFIPDESSLAAIKTRAHSCNVNGVFVSHCEVFIQDHIFNGAYLKYLPLSNIYHQTDIIQFFSQQLKINVEPYFQAYILMFSTQFMADANVNDFDVLVPIISKIGLRCLEHKVSSYPQRRNIKVETGGFAVQDKHKLFFHHIGCDVSKDTINEPVCYQIIEEFLKFINRPSPALIREFSNFVKEIIIVPVDRRLQCVQRFGHDTTLFSTHYQYFLQNFGNFVVDVPSISQLNFKVCYNKDSFVNDGKTQQITPVIQPRASELALDQNKSTSFSSDLTDKFIQVPANSFRSSYTDSVGRWGEAVINQMFRTHNLPLTVGETILEISWVNEVSESMLPYDFLLKTAKDGHEKNVYIEVKASSNPKSPSFELSINEIEFALHCKGNYHVYKVTPKTYKQSFELVKQDDCNIKIYKNLIHHLRKKYIR
ncbi:hypothetical protein MXB_4291, partial [Myxobolus squamalis]